MSTTVDNRVVEMQFDNKQFERNVQTTMSTLDKLKNGLDLSNSARGLESIGTAARNISLNGLSGAIETVHSKFSAMEVMAVTALANITNSAVNAGKRMISALTIDPIKTGFQEYETQINSVQTILANTQEHQKQVSQAAVEEINKAAQASCASAISANEKALTNLKKTQKKQLEDFNDLADEELRALNDKYDDQLDVLKEAIEEENKTLKKAHDEKLAMYEEEYMERLKVVDEERYNAIKAVEDQIEAIEALTKSEEEAIKKAEQEEKLASLEQAVMYAETMEEREAAEKKLNKYKEELARKELLAERDRQIEALKANKDTINAEYDLKEENIKKEYELQVASEKKRYESDLEKIKNTEEKKREQLKDTHEEEERLLKKKIKTERAAFEEQQAATVSAMESNHEQALRNIETEKQARIAALTASAGMTKASTLEDVNAALDELNTYADKTIYNFTEMTRNIGTFTAAGIDLETSVTAIKGIANLAAVSGSTSQQASTAMYQLSQALASGTVKLMDWNSVVNAGMGGQVFQDALKETARVHGIEIDNMIAQEGSFRETLKHGWLTSDVLTETLAKFTGDLTEDQLRSMGYNEEQIAGIIKMGQTANDAATKVKTFTQLFDTLKEAAQSGWTSTWEIIVGDFEEAKELLTSISDTFGALISSSSNARNALLQGWKDLGGRTALIEAFKNAFQGLVSVITPVKEAFREIFPPMTSEKLFALTEGLKNLTAKLKLSDEQSANLKSTFKGLFAVVDICKEAFVAVWTAVKPLIGGVGSLAGSILGVTGSWGEWLVKLRDTIKETNLFGDAAKKVAGIVTITFNGLKTVIGGVIKVGKALFELLKEKIGVPGLEVIHKFLERVQTRMSGVVKATGEMKDGLAEAFAGIVASAAWKTFSAGMEGFLILFESLWKAIKKIAGAIGNFAKSMGEGLAEAFGNADFEKVFDIINGGLFAAILLGIKNFVKNINDAIDEVGGVIAGVSDILDSVRGCFEAYQKNLQAKTLLTIASAIGILAASILVISTIDSKKLSASLGAVTVLFADLMASIALFSKINSIRGVTKTVTAMLGISVSVLILASALKKIADIDLDDLVKGLAGVAGLTTTVVVAAKAMSSSEGAILKGATSLIALGAAVAILASVCKDLSSLKWDELAKGLVGVGVLMAEVSIFLNTAKFSSKAVSTATGMVVMGAAIKILASACVDFGAMKWEEIIKGLTSVGVLLGEIVLFTKLTGNAKNVVSTSAAMVLLGSSMLIFAEAIKDMSTMSWEQLAKGLLGMAGALTAVTVAFNLMPNNMVGLGTGLIAASTALVILAEALDKMGGFTWDEIAKGLVSLGGSLLILAAGLNLMNGTLAGSAALTVASVALLALAPALSILGAMSWESIAKGLIALAGAFAVIGVAGLAITPIIPGVLALAGAFTLISVGALALGAALMATGVGLSAIATGFLALAGIGAAGATAVVAAITVVIVGIVALIPEIVKKLGEGVIEFCKAIAAGAPELCKAFKAVLLSLLDVIVECVPAISNGILKLVDELLKGLVQYTPSIVNSLFDFLILLINGVADKLPELIKAAVNFIGKFFTGVVDALKGVDTDALLKGIAGVGLLSGLMVALSAVAGMIPAAMAGVAGMGLVIAEMTLILAGIGALAQLPGLSWLIGEGGKLLEKVGVAIGQFIGGIVGGVMGGISGQFPKIGTDLSQFMTNIQPFIDGAKSIDASAMSGVKALAETILILTAAELLNGLTSWLTGGTSLASFGEELVPFGKAFATYAKSIEGIDNKVVEASSNAALTLAKMAKTLPNQGGVVSWFAGENTLSQFATELIPFGKSMKKYSDEIKGLDGKVVTESANAALALAKMAAELPNQGGMVSWFTGENTLSEFAEELAPFGRSMKIYSDAVKGLDAGVITESANAASALAQMAENLPNQGGMVSWFTGDNKLSEFATELIPFGRSMKTYSEYVKGLDSSVIIESANAASALSRMSENLPNKGGMVSWFTGDNTLSKFADELIPFGRSMKSYFNNINGIDGNIVTASANAATALSRMASGLPNQGGVVSWFSGDNTLSKFGKELVPFGKSMKEYSKEVADINYSVVNGTVNAVSALVKLQESLPDEKGWFSSDATLADFGKMAKDFGKEFNSYYVNVKGVNIEILNKVISATNNLISMAKGLQNFDASGMSSFSKALKKLGSDGVNDFINEFSNAEGKIKTSAATMLNNFVSGANAKKDVLTDNFSCLVQNILNKLATKNNSFFTAGETYVDKMIAGAESRETSAIKTFTTLASDCLSKLKSQYKSFEESGSTMIEKFRTGVTSKKATTVDKFKDIASDCLYQFKNKLSDFKDIGIKLMDEICSGAANRKSSLSTAFTSGISSVVTNIRSYYNNFYSAGTYLVTGFVKGIKDNISKAEDAAESLGKAAIDATKKELDEHSPSRVFYQIGDYAGVAFVNALNDYEGKAANAGKGMANAAVLSMNNSIAKIAAIVESGIDTEPTIRPVLDLSNIESGTSRLNAMFSRNRALSISAGMNRSYDEKIQNGVNPSGGNSYQLVQNNYSPKALSRRDIYRQTKNQFSTLKGLVNT